MFSNISFNDYRCQLENRMPSSYSWEKNENMAYCEGFSALVCKNKASKLEKALTNFIISLIK